MVFSICKKMKIKGVFFVPLVAVLFAGLVYFFFAANFSNYGAAQRLLYITKFFDTAEKDSILFLGDSQTREGIDCTLIADNCYNLGVAGILPTQLLFLKEKIVNIRPKKVIIGVSQLFFNEAINMNLDYYYILSNENASESALKNLNTNEKNILSQNRFQKIVYKRKFILPFFAGIIRPADSENLNNKTTDLKQPFVYTKDQTTEQIQEKLSDERILNLFRYENTEQRQKDAFVGLIRELKKDKIEIVVLQFPLNPMLLDKEDMKEFNEFLKNTSKEDVFELRNYQNLLDKSNFIDISHLNTKGRRGLASLLKGDKHII
jgi:hypothetical protein